MVNLLLLAGGALLVLHMFKPSQTLDHGTTNLTLPTTDRDSRPSAAEAFRALQIVQRRIPEKDVSDLASLILKADLDVDRSDIQPKESKDA
jgi:hypothetical protein